jgi:TolB-like protein/Flp pilus assembly protein TadD
VKTATKVCENCGDKILGDSPKGLCPACVLETGLGPLADETVAVIDDPGHPAGVLMDFGDYELLEEIGRGGQGVVYRARQKSLNRTVALKVIGLGQWATQAHLKRFRREAESAANLDHRCIVPIYEVGEREGSCYFSMKFIDGGQLDEVARRTPIPIRNAAELIAKLARTVHYAHEHGILHRDIKPGNILLDAKGEPHLTDFGLARLLETKSTVTHTMDVLGTPSYMAPEQASGHNEQLTSATDVYGLGAVFYQLLTGHPPFAGGTTYETVRLVLETEPRQPRLWNPKIDRELSTICLKCLEKDPKRRYSSALALAEDLEHWLKHEPIRAKRSGILIHAAKWIRRNPSIAALLTVSAGLATGLGVMVWNRESGHPILEKSVAVLPFENLSGNPDSAYFADGIQEEILTRLAAIADLKVISRTSTQHYQSKPRNLSQIAKQLGVANILEGSVQKTADHVRVNVQLINAQTDSHLWAETYDRKLTDIFSVESEIAKAIAEQLQAKLTGQEEQIIAAKPTDNVEAYNAYLRGLACDLRMDALRAQTYLREAVRLDPKFALAWALLSYVDARGYIQESLPPTDALRDEARQAAETALTLQPNLGEALIAKGQYHYACLKEYDTAVRYFEQARQLLPNNSRISECLANVTRKRGQWDESEMYFNEAERLDPRNVNIISNHARSYIHFRRFPEALRKLDQVLNIIPDDIDTLAKKAIIAQAEGDLPRAAVLLAPLHPTTDNFSALEEQVYQAILERRPAPVMARLKEILANPAPASGYVIGELRFWLGWAQEVAGDRAAAQENWRQAHSELESFLKGQSEKFTGLCDLALTSMGLGDKAAAFALTEQAMAALPIEKDAIVGPESIEVLARVAAQMEEPDRAIAALRQLLSIPYWGTVSHTPLTPALLRLDPMFDPLRSDPRFQELCKDKIDKSIAVLPFENLSRDPDNAYFAEGIQEEILTRLAGIADLKVISRASTQRYQSKPRDLSQIAKQLGVANILEGSVQKAADQVRVNVQLVNAQTDSHLWGETYDRKLTDILGVESEIAKRIAESLRAKLTGREEQALVVKLTNNPEAYDAYLRGVAFDVRSVYSMNPLWKVVGFCERAVQLDPNFTVAWARLSRGHGSLYSRGEDTTAARRDAAKKALEHAQKLQPNSPETLLALSYYQYRVLRDYSLAKSTFGRVREMLPSSSDALHGVGRAARREGNWDESVASWEEALAIDPRNTELLSDAADTYAMLRQFSAALKLYDRALDIIPNDPELIMSKAEIYQAQGNLEEAAKSLSEINAQTNSETALKTRMTQLRLERNHAEAVRLLQARQTQFHYAREFDKCIDQVLLAFTQRFAGDSVGAKSTAAQARNALEPLCRNQPENSRFAAFLSLSYAALGNKDSALKEAERAIMLLPSAKDAVSGPAYEEVLALIQTMVGEHSRAISTLTRLLRTPYTASALSYREIPITPAVLRLDPLWDPLRADPAFQKLCEENQP